MTKQKLGLNYWLREDCLIINTILMIGSRATEFSVASWRKIF